MKKLLQYAGIAIIVIAIFSAAMGMHVALEIIAPTPLWVDN